MKRILLVFMFTIYCFSSLQAQWYKKAKERVFRRSTPTTTMSHRLSTAMERQERARVSLEALPAPLNRAVFTVRESHRLWRHLRKGIATSFVIEGPDGKKWAVTTPHLHLHKAILFDQQTGEHLQIPDAYSSGLWDIVILELPKELDQQAAPLHLAEQNPVLGQTLYSVGFFENEYHVETNRVVQEVGPNRMFTSLKIDRSCVRAGACGGPLLNEAGEVVGVHVGSHKEKDLGFVVPVSRIRDLLKEAYQKTIPQEPLIFNGQQIGTLSRNQRIRSIKAYHNGKLIQDKKTYLHENEVDYSNLEQFIGTTQVDKLVLIIVDNILHSQSEKQGFQAFSLTYNFSTGQSSIKQAKLQHPFYVHMRNYLKQRALDLLTVPDD